MKYFFLFMILCVYAGSAQPRKKIVEWKSLRQPKTDSINTISLSPKNYEISKTYPFSEAVKIELFSYPDRMKWDQGNKKHGTAQDVNILRNGKMDIKKKKIKEKKELTSSQQTELFDILYNTSCDDKKPMRCYDPRHALIFYDSDRKAFAFIEICLACRTARTSAGVQVDISCVNRVEDLIALFKRMGITYGLNGKDE